MRFQPAKRHSIRSIIDSQIADVLKDAPNTRGGLVQSSILRSASTPKIGTSPIGTKTDLLRLIHKPDAASNHTRMDCKWKIYLWSASHNKECHRQTGDEKQRVTPTWTTNRKAKKKSYQKSLAHHAAETLHNKKKQHMRHIKINK